MEPLAYRMMPKSLDEYVGQKHIIGKNKVLYKIIKEDKLSSLILWGPAGVGKTSLVNIISNETRNKVYKLNAVFSGVNDIKKIIEETENLLLNPTGKSIVFIDEIHRFNKAQQDFLLPFVENGTIIFIGATTENPYFSINKSLISRSFVFELYPLEKQDVLEALKKSLISERGLKEYKIKITDEVLNKIVEISNGDIRTALNTLEIVVLTSKIDKNGFINITEENLKDCVQNKKMVFDKNGEDHYNNISAFIKSIRGSDPDATLFYLAKMLNSGEDPVFIGRRIVISAAEDIGLADPQALVISNAMLQSVKLIGMPEAKLLLAEAAVYCANAKKSNASYLGIKKALKDVENKDVGEVPRYLRNNDIEIKNYKYPHDYKNHWVEQEYLPKEFIGIKYFELDENIDTSNFQKK